MKTYYVEAIDKPHNANRSYIMTFTPEELAKACCIDATAVSYNLKFNYSRPNTSIMSIYELLDDGQTKVMHHTSGGLSLKDKVSDELKNLIPVKRDVVYAEGMK